MPSLFNGFSSIFTTKKSVSNTKPNATVTANTKPNATVTATTKPAFLTSTPITTSNATNRTNISQEESELEKIKKNANYYNSLPDNLKRDPKFAAKAIITNRRVSGYVFTLLDNNYIKDPDNILKKFRILTNNNRNSMNPDNAILSDTEYQTKHRGGFKKNKTKNKTKKNKKRKTKRR